MTTRQIYCCGCDGYVEARLTDGGEIYPHRRDLASLPFWKCDTCQNYVGCHHKTKDRTRPLGNIPTKELREARGHIHRILDPIWKNGHLKRGDVYARVAERMGIAEYHTANIVSVVEAREAYKAVEALRRELAL